MLSSWKYVTSMEVLVLVTIISITTVPTQCKDFSIEDLKGIEVLSVPVKTYRKGGLTQEGNKDSLTRQACPDSGEPNILVCRNGQYCNVYDEAGWGCCNVKKQDYFYNHGIMKCPLGHIMCSGHKCKYGENCCVKARHKCRRAKWGTGVLGITGSKRNRRFDDRMCPQRVTASQQEGWTARTVGWQWSLTPKILYFFWN